MKYDAIVVGAGLPGALAAWRLSQAGLKVAVFERNVVAGESSALAAGHVPQESVSPDNLKILRRTRALVDDIDRRTDGAVRFNIVGGIQVATQESGKKALEDHSIRTKKLGGRGELLGAAEVAARWPAIETQDLLAAYYTPDDGFVRSHELTITLSSLARMSGAEVVEGSPVDMVAIQDGRVTGVVVGGDVVRAPRVLVAAGAWSRPLLERSGISLPTKSFVLQAVILNGATANIPFVSDLEAGYYVMRRTSTSVFLGLPPSSMGVDADAFSRHPEPDDRARFLEILRCRVPELAGAAAAGGWAGVLVATPDGWPLLGQHAAEGLFVATGFGGGGVQRVTGAEAVAQVMLGQEPFVDLTAYRVSRFEGYSGEDFEFRQGPFYYTEWVDAPVEPQWRK